MFDIKRGIAEMVYMSCEAAKNENMSNKELVEELYKPIITKFKKKKKKHTHLLFIIFAVLTYLICNS